MSAPVTVARGILLFSIVGSYFVLRATTLSDKKTPSSTEGHSQSPPREGHSLCTVSAAARSKRDGLRYCSLAHRPAWAGSVAM